MTVSFTPSRRSLMAGAGASLLIPGLVRAAEKDCFVFLGASKVSCADVDGSNLRTLFERPTPAGAAPAQAGRGMAGLYDGIAIDKAAGHVYWTDMGRANADDGTITRTNLDGSNAKIIVPAGGTFTPKQLKLEPKTKKLYWSDREGMRVMRSNLDGSNIETLVQTGSGDADRQDQSRWCVGISVDVDRGHVYWTQKGGDNAGTGTIKRAAINVPRGQTPANRTDIETLFANMPEPIDLDLDLTKRQIYWTDRGDNTISRAPLDAKGFDPKARKDREILLTGLGEAIGLSLDFQNKRLFYTALGGNVGTASIDGKNHKVLLTGQGTLTGIEVLHA